MCANERSAAHTLFHNRRKVTLAVQRERAPPAQQGGFSRECMSNQRSIVGPTWKPLCGPGA